MKTRHSRNRHGEPVWTIELTGWHEIIRFASNLLYHVDGKRARASSGAPSVLVAYGPEDAAKLADSGIAGQVVVA